MRKYIAVRKGKRLVLNPYWNGSRMVYSPEWASLLTPSGFSSKKEAQLVVEALERQGYLPGDNVEYFEAIGPTSETHKLWAIPKMY